MSLTTWPQVVGEEGTLTKLQKGYSIARFGDGEAALMAGGAQIREPRNPALARELRQTLVAPHRRVLLGIPTMDPAGAKIQNWTKRQKRFLSLLQPNWAYYSAFITRPDSAPWIRNWRYAKGVVALWRDKRVVLVAEKTDKGVAIVRLLQRTCGTGKMIHIPCPHSETYSVANEIECAVVRSRPEITLLSCGPAGTVLANRLAYHNIWAIDIGSAGGFLLKELYGSVDRLRVFALGVQRTGTTSLGAALTKAGFVVAHNRPKWIANSYHTGQYLIDAHQRGHDPVDDMPGVGAIVHPSVCVRNPKPVNMWPQMNPGLIDAVRKYHPECVFVLNTRPVSHWIRSISQWKDFRQRLTEANIPGLPPGVGAHDEDLRTWITGHWERMRSIFTNDRQHFVEIDIEDPAQCEERLSAALGREIRWPWLNKGSTQDALSCTLNDSRS